MVLMKISETEAGFLAGVIEGEGSIFLMKKKCSRSRLGYNYTPCISISNTDPRLLTRCKSIIDKIKSEEKYRTIIRSQNGGKLNTPERKLRKNWDGRWKIGWVLRMHDFGTIVSVLNETSGLFVTKKRQAGLLMEYCKSRMLKLFIFRRNMYSEREHAIYKNLRRLNRRGLKTQEAKDTVLMGIVGETA